MSRNKRKSNKDESSKTTIIVAIIGLIGTVITAYLSFAASVKLHGDNITETVTPVLVPNAINETPTNTFVMTLSPTTPEPTRTVMPSNGKDISSGCIESGYWRAYSTTELLSEPSDYGNCWELSKIGISAQNNGLVFVSEPPKFGFNWLNTGIGWWNNTIEFTIKIDQLSFGDNYEPSIFAVGVVPSDSSNPLDDGYFLLFSSKEIGELNAGLKSPTGYNSRWTTSLGSTGRYTFGFDGIILTIKADNNMNFSPMNLPFDNRSLYFGYNAPRGSRVWVTINDISIQSENP